METLHSTDISTPLNIIGEFRVPAPAGIIKNQLWWKTVIKRREKGSM